MQKLRNFIKRETVLCAAGLLAALSCLLVVPDKKYLQYIDYRTLGLLLSLMLVMTGVQDLGVFTLIGAALLRQVHTQRMLCAVLTLLCLS